MDSEIEINMKKFIVIFSSLASLLCLCKPVLANDTSIWADGFNIGGYASAGLTLERNEEAQATLNEVSILLTWNGDTRWRFFSELELENPLSWNGDRKFHTKGSHIDLERLYFDYNLSEKVNFRVGRFLTPNSRWNLLHAPPLVWTSTRPLATSRLFPTGTNGVMLFGALPFVDSVFEYKLFSEVLEDQKLEDQELKFEHVHGARFSLKNQSDIGVSFLSFREKGNNTENYRMLGLDFFTHIKSIEVSGEAFQRFNTKNKDGGSGAYLQTAVPLTGIGLNNWHWITRLETFQRPDESSAERWLLGAAWRVKPRHLLKIELTGGSGEQPNSPRGFLTSYALFF